MPYFKNYRIQVLYVFLLILPIIGIAGPGGWVSSGGEIFKNAKNPWFVKNTQVVHYCLEYSESEMTLKSSDTQNLIEQALLYWKNEFNEISPIGSGYSLTQKANQAQIANQNFTKDETCNKDSDLIFKFGYSKLNQEEIDYLKDPQKFLGVTIRKVYDEENLKGKGVIFISGDLGSHSYKKTSADVIDQAWKYPKLLLYVLIHELGHVFGLPHSGSGLMSEVFLDQLLIQKIAALYVREPLMPFIKAVDTAIICDNSVLPIGTQSFVAGYFNLKYKEDCLKILPTSKAREFALLSKKLKDTDWKQFGTLFIDKNELIDFSLKPAVLIQLNDQQKVFSTLDNSFIIGPVFQNYKVDGHINFGNSMKPYSVQVDFSPDSLIIYGIYENSIRQIFSFGNPFLFNLLKPF